jgi:hydrogenase 3 maturation protease
LTEPFEGRLRGATRLAIMGVGSELRADDAAGLIVADLAERATRRRGDVLVVKACTAPENFLGVVIGFEPSHLAIVDCAELDAPPGTVRLFPVQAIGGVSSSTHSLPLSIVIDYLRKSHPCEVIVVGIQPENLEFDGRPTKAVLAAARRVARDLVRAAGAMGRK